MRLETFGGLALTGGGASSLSGQRRRLAFLALLAAAGERGLSRDQLLGYLWPESSSETARHSLEQLLYGLRRVLGDAAFAGVNPLRLNREVVSSDLAEFEGALSRQALADAVALYRGPFLQGFFVNDAPEFEHWMESERARLASLYEGALHQLVGQAQRAGDQSAAVRWSRQLAEADSTSSRYALGLMRALVASGDRGAALQHARIHEMLLRQELQSPPDPGVAAFAAELRAVPVSPPAVAVASTDSAAQSTVARTVAQSPRSTAFPAPTSPAPLRAAETGGIATDNRPRVRKSALRPSVLVVGFVALAIGATWVAARPTRSGRARLADPDRILVPPFRITYGDSSIAHLRELLPVLLSAQLTGEGGPAAIDTRATMSALRRATPVGGGEVTEDRLLGIGRELGAGHLLIGEVIRVGPDGLELSGRVVSSTTNGSGGVRASVAGSADSVPALVKRLAAHLLALHAGEHPQRILSLAQRSPEALRAFLQGRAEHRRSRDGAAMALFARALDHDSTFALAALELVSAHGRLFRRLTIRTDSVRRTSAISLAGGSLSPISDEDQWLRAMDLAWRGRDQLSVADRAMLLAWRGDHYPRPISAREALVGWEGAIRAAPDRAEAHYWYGRVLMQQGFALGLADSRTRAVSSFREALKLDSAFLSPLSWLVEIAAYERAAGELRRLRARYLALDSTGAEADYVRWLTAAALRDEAALRNIRARFDSLDIPTLGRIQRASQMTGLALEDAEHADSIILGRTHDRQQRQIALYRAVFLAHNRGRPEHALRLMELKREVDPDPETGLGYAVRYTLMWDADSVTGARAAHALQRIPTPAASNVVTLWRLWHGDSTGAAAAIAQLRLTNEQVTDLLDALLAAVAHRSDAPATLARLDSLAKLGCCRQPNFVNLVSARLHERAGNLPAALAAIRRGRWYFPAEYLSTYLREEGRLAALAGDTTGAIAAYRDYLTLRSNAEPSLQPAVAQVRAELVRLETARGAQVSWRRLWPARERTR